MKDINIVLSLIVILNVALFVLILIVLKSLKKIQYTLKQPAVGKLDWNKQVKPYNKDRNRLNASKSNNTSSNQFENRQPRQRTRLAGGNQAKAASTSSATSAKTIVATPEKVKTPLPQRKPRQAVGENIQPLSTEQNVAKTSEGGIKHGRRASSH